MSIASMPVGQAPDQVLQQALHGMVPEIKPYEALAELNSRVKSKQLNVAQQGQQAIQQALQLRQQPTVAQTLMQQNQALDAGIGQLNVPESQSFASGGIVAFEEGGFIDRLPEDSILRMARDWVSSGRPRLDKPLLEKLFEKIGGDPYSTPEEPNQPKEPATWGAETRPNRPIEPRRIVPPSLKDEAKARVASVTRTGNAPRAGTSGRTGLKAPTFDLTAPEYEAPEARGAASFAAESDKLISPRMSEYDQRMQKYRDRALAMQRGEGIEKPSRLKRGIDSALAGATDEVMAARRAGIRPSLGMALAGAGKAASASDKEYKDKLAAMQEKGFEREFALEQARIAQERGEQDRAQKWVGVAEQRAAEIRNIANAGKDKKFDVDKLREGREMDLYKLDRQAEEKAKDRAATLAAASMRSAGSGSLTPQRISEIRRKVEADLDKELKEDINYMRMLIKTPALAEQEKVRRYEARLQRALAEESGIVGPTPGATPGAAPTRVIDFSTIK